MPAPIVPQWALQNALRGYVECMQWANTFRWVTDPEGLETEPDGELYEPSPAAFAAATEDVRGFLEETEGLPETEAYLEARGYAHFGHDFALSRNGLGAGFFDRDEGYPELQRMARVWGSATWVVNEETEELEVLE